VSYASIAGSIPSAQAKEDAFMYPRFQQTNIWEEMEKLQRRMNRLLEGGGSGPRFSAPTYPAVNVWVNEEGQLITAEMPGLKPEDISIDVTADALSISGEREAPEAGKDADYHRQERSYGSFSRTIQLPFVVDPEGVQASFQNGVLLIKLPRAEADKPKRIAVQAQ
jgi:HSP20 family protein